MIQVKLVTATTRKTVTVDPNQTVRTVLEENNIDYDVAPVFLDGAQLNVGEHDKTFTELNIKEKCILTAVVKTANA